MQAHYTSVISLQGLIPDTRFKIIKSILRKPKVSVPDREKPNKRRIGICTFLDEDVYSMTCHSELGYGS